MIALGYVRRSKKSDDRAVSVDTQVTAIAAYCDHNGVTLAATIVHDGISGTKRRRLDVLQAAIVQHSATLILCYHRDRLARDVAGLMDLLRNLHARGIIVREVTTGQDLSVTKSQDFLVTGVAGIFDEYFPRLVGEKTAAALQHKKSRGLRYSGIAPFGYRFKNDEMIPHEEEQRALAIIRECGRAGMGRYRTLKHLRSSGYVGRGSLTTIQKLLTENGGDPA